MSQYPNHHTKTRHDYRKRNFTAIEGASDTLPNKRQCVPFVSYTKLQAVERMSSDEILNEIIHQQFPLYQFLRDKQMEKRFDWIHSMTIILEKITKCTELTQHITSVFHDLPNTSYLEGVYNEILEVDDKTNQIRFAFIESFLEVSSTFISLIPNQIKALTKITERLELLILKTASTSPVQLINSEFESLKRKLNKILEYKNNRETQPLLTRNVNAYNTTNTNHDPFKSTGNYKDLPVIPSLNEIVSGETPYLLKNIVDGVYENAEQYLDIHFRLLREDFVAPLRDGIQQYLSQVPGKNMNVRVYENVKFCRTRCASNSGLVYDLQLDPKAVSRIHWANSRRLIYGNLLIVTFNNFRSCAYLTVADRSQIEKQFIISVKEFQNYNRYRPPTIRMDMIDSSHSLTVLETTVYFEAYYPILAALKKVPTNHEFPLHEFILKLKNEMTPPNYITPATKYDFTPLLVGPNSDVKTVVDMSISKFPIAHKRIKYDRRVHIKIDYRNRNELCKKYGSVCVLNKDEWPTSEELHLNPKQREALMLALTNKVALIQGPPGTGKTYLGVRILQMLLYNRLAWCASNERSAPILMICHTNHALDQFLELLVKRLNLSQGVIRVGSRCENERIKPFSLRNAHQRYLESRSMPCDIYDWKREILQEKRSIEERSRSYEKRITKSETYITSLSVFAGDSIIDKAHVESLLKPYCSDATQLERAFFEWFGILDMVEGVPRDSIFGENPQKTNVVSINNHKVAKHKELNEEDEEEIHRQDENEIDDDYTSLSGTHESEMDITDNVNDHDSGKWYELQTKLDRLCIFIKRINARPTTFNNVTVKQITDLWALSETERYDLYGYWLSTYQKILRDQIQWLHSVYNENASNFAKYRQEADQYILKNSLIVAMTTTCAAKYQNVLEKLGSKIVIVEEAAAIFEAHIITALSTSCQHLIMIGDHVQLRPNPTTYHLGVNYHLDISLFERLIKNNLPSVQLNIQHRMRPEIARLMKHFYSDLHDHTSVKTQREPVRNVNSNVFFINHKIPEEKNEDSYSKRNQYEAEYAVELTKYLVKQGYKTHQITILVMYLGQRQCIALKTKDIPLLRGVRIAVTDNYQGEENDIIILSLVRSNPENRIGFLSIRNRICVALSRARCGLFVIGNMDMLAEVSDMWKNIVTSLTETNEIGKGVSLSCRQHPEPKFIADTPESFSKRPAGGCEKKCDARLECGHRCRLKCHNNDLEHSETICKVACGHVLSCDHLCKSQCHFKTPNEHAACDVLISKTIPECGHTITVKCSVTPTSRLCSKQSLRQLPCGHSVHVPCSIITSPEKMREFSCPEPCDATLACQHKCAGTCKSCNTGKLHIACEAKCDRELICSHVCRASCSTNCPPCSRCCEERCIHSRCKKTCGSLCYSCREPCGYKCKHLKCTRLCYEPCDRKPCNKRCEKKLRCRHRCIGLCGEPCPPQCRICDKDIVQEILFGNEDEPDARFVYLPDCKHIIEVTALDKFIEDFVHDTNDKRAIRFPECPRCRQKIYRCTRYTTIINKANNMVRQAKKKMLGNSTEEERNDRQRKLLKEYTDLQCYFKEDMKKFITLYKRNKVFTDDILNLLENVITFLREIEQILIDGDKKLTSDGFSELVRSPLYRIVKYLFKQKADRNFSEQQIQDIGLELERIRRVIYIKTLIPSIKKELNDEEKQDIDSMKNLTNKSGPFTKKDQQDFDGLVEKCKYLNNLPGLGINESERKAIISALNLSKGRWFICPNGHPYLITECGGANQESQCPDCGERIGGTNHRVVSTNRHFGLMDGSQRTAWPNQGN